jgi:hypothetical protein
MRRFKLLAGLCLVVGALIVAATPAQAAPLADNCERVNGTVTCTTFDGPGNNQAGVGETEIVETQGNTKNKSPEEQQGLEDDEFCQPPNSQGTPCFP